MSARCFVDTNILVYAHDRTAGSKHEQARRLIDHLWDTGEGSISTQVLQELCVTLRRKLACPLPMHEVRQLIRDYSAWNVVVNTPESILEAMEIESRYKTSFWDAMIVYAAEASGAEILYSEDLAAGQKFHRIQVQNPFKGGGIS